MRILDSHKRYLAKTRSVSYKIDKNNPRYKLERCHGRQVLKIKYFVKKIDNINNINIIITKRRLSFLED